MVEGMPSFPGRKRYSEVVITDESGNKATIGGTSSDELKMKVASDDVGLATETSVSKEKYQEFQITNRCSGITPTTVGWTTAPTSLANIVDGDYTTATGTGVEDSATDSYVQLDLAKVYTGHLKVKVGYWLENTTNYHTFRVRISTDNVTWQTIKYIDTSDTTERTWTLEFPFVSARYIRLQSRQAFAAGTDGYLKVYEVAFFASEGQPSNPSFVLAQGDYYAAWGRLEPYLSSGTTYYISLSLFCGSKSVVSVYAYTSNQTTTFVVEGSHDGANWGEMDRFTLQATEGVVFSYVTAAPLVRIRTVELDSIIYMWICAR